MPSKVDVLKSDIQTSSISLFQFNSDAPKKSPAAPGMIWAKAFENRPRPIPGAIGRREPPAFPKVPMSLGDRAAVAHWPTVPLPGDVRNRGVTVRSGTTAG